MTSEKGHLTVMDEDLSIVAKWKARQGALGLILGSGFTFFAIVILRDVVLAII